MYQSIVEEGKMSKTAIRATIVAILLVAGAAVAQKLFHEQSSVTFSITFSSRSFSVNGNPTWIFAGEVAGGGVVTGPKMLRYETRYGLQASIGGIISPEGIDGKRT
jgi:hypothetical protein